MFEHDGIAIRPIEESDLERMLALRADPRIWARLGDISMVNMRSQQQWFLGLHQDPNRRYFVLCSSEVEFLGIVRMDEIDWINRSVRVGGDILPKYQHRGHGSKMFDLIKKYCFDYLNMHRLWLLVLEKNDIARNMYVKAGFVEEGRQRQAIFRDGCYQDYVMMSLLRSEKTWVSDRTSDMSPIPFFKPYVNKRAMDLVAETLESGWIGEGPRVQEFEKKFGELVESPFPVAVNSGTSALQLGLIVAGVRAGDEVLTTAQTMLATTQSILACGATPVYADISCITRAISTPETW